MQENWLALAHVFSTESPSVLATMINTEGATYQKMGAMILVDHQGHCSGLLSGGCLEADIAIHAKEVLRTGLTNILSYDLSSDADLLWGLGLGCEGKIDILLQPLTSQNNYLGFADMLASVLAGKQGIYYQAISSNEKGRGFFVNDDGQTSTEPYPAIEQFAGYDIIKIPAFPPISLLLCGAGPDAAPVVAFAQQLGWQVALWDHRKASLAQPAFHHVTNKRKVRAEQVTANELQSFHAAVVMTHNLTHDQTYLSALLTSNIPYIGLLGPARRRDKMLHALGYEHSAVEDRVFGPVGLDIGGRSPQAIALSITAQVQQQLMQTFSNQHEKPSIINAKP